MNFLERQPKRVLMIDINVDLWGGHYDGFTRVGANVMNNHRTPIAFLLMNITRQSNANNSV